MSTKIPHSFREFKLKYKKFFHNKPKINSFLRSLTSDQIKAVLNFVYKSYPEWWNFKQNQTLEKEVNTNFNKIETFLKEEQDITKSLTVDKNIKTTLASIYIAYFGQHLDSIGYLIHDAWCSIVIESNSKNLKKRKELLIPYDDLSEKNKDKDLIWVTAWQMIK